MTRWLEYRWVRILASLISGALFYFSLGLTPLWMAAWLAPIPLLLSAFYAPSWREAAALSYLAIGIGVSSNFTYYLKTTGPVATPILLLLYVLLWGFLVTRTRSAVRRSDSWTSVFVLPVLMAAANTLISYFSPHGTWGSYAYTQMDALPVIQIASVMGEPAVVFLVGLFASTIAVAIYRSVRINRPWLAYGLPVALLVAGIGYGFARLALAPTEPTLRVGLASVDDFISARISPKEVEAVWARYEELVTAMAKQGAKVVVLPEKIEALTPAEAILIQRRLAELSRRNGVYLVVGVQLNGVSDKSNASWLFGPTEGLIVAYHKQHLVPHLESDLTPGQENIVRNIDGAPFGLAVCRDLLFTDFGRDYGKLGVSAMLVPAWDFYVDARMAASVGAMQGVENGYSVVRAGRESYLNVSDRFGFTVGRQRSDFLPGASLVLDLPLGPAKPTLYARFGNWFGLLCIGGLLVILLWGQSGVPVSEGQGGRNSGE